MKINKNIQTQKDFYQPGRVIFCDYWKSYDKVIDFKVFPDGWQWFVTVISCDKEGNALPGAYCRTHCTSKDKRDYVSKEADFLGAYCGA